MHHNILISYSKRGQNNLFAIQYFDCCDITDCQCTFYFHYNIHCANYFTTSFYLITVKSTGSISNDRTFPFFCFFFLFVFCFFFYNNPPPPKKNIVIYISTHIWVTMKCFTIFSQKRSISLSLLKKNNHGLAKSRFCQFWYVYLLPKAMQRKTNWNAFSVISLHSSGSEGINDIPAY